VRNLAGYANGMIEFTTRRQITSCHLAFFVTKFPPRYFNRQEEKAREDDFGSVDFSVTGLPSAVVAIVLK